APSRLHAASLDNGKPATLPSALADLSNIAFINADATTVAWVQGPDLTDLFAWRASWPEPQRVVESRKDTPLQWVHVAGDIITWDNSQAQFAADLRSGGYTQLTPQWGSTDSWGTVLHIGFAPAKFDGKTPTQETIVDTSALPPLPGCA
ncbi:MAG TPA: hypothetical protein VF054_08875, partial [Micromonosporaceae bacterium]